MEIINVVGYVRTSPGARQGEQTVQEQIKKIEEFCQDKGYNLLAVYRDENVAGNIPLAMRPGGSLLLTASAHQGIKALVICSICRLGRDIRVNEVAVRELYDERGIMIWGVTQDIDVSTTAGRFMFICRHAMRSVELWEMNNLKCSNSDPDLNLDLV